MTTYDWNKMHDDALRTDAKLVDETLRDGIQSPAVCNPSADDKVALLHHMARCGIEVANVGLPGAGKDALDDCTRLVKEIVAERLDVAPNCAARTHKNDIAAVAEVSQRAGYAVECCAFLGASPVRRDVEGWDMQRLTSLVSAAGDQCGRAGLPFSFVTEDTSRTDPETLRTLWRVAIDHGATRLVLTDTAGHATYRGVRNLVEFAQRCVDETGAEVRLDWHGHDDRGLALANGLTAIAAGVDRVHGTCLGVGERVGNTPIDLMLVNLAIAGARSQDLRPVSAYVAAVQDRYEVDLPSWYPVFGEDAFRTATGVHAAAIVKALAGGRTDLADEVYSSVPSAWLGRSQRIAVGYYSGRANVLGWLRLEGLDATDERVDAVLKVAKRSRRTLTDTQVREALDAAGLLG